MDFKSITVRNFRSFENISIEVTNKNVFFGLNDVGKTNLLTALRFVFDRNVRKNDFLDSDYFEKNVERPIEIEICIDISKNDDNTEKIRPYIKGAITSGDEQIYIKLLANYDESELLGTAEMFWGSDPDNLQEMKSKGNKFDIDNIFNVYYIDSYVDMDRLFKKNIKKFIKSDEEDVNDQCITDRIDTLVSDLNENISNLSGVSNFESKVNPIYKTFNDEKMSISVKSEMAVRGLYSNIVPYMKKDNDDKIYPTAGEGRKKLVVYSLFSLLAAQESDKKINLFLIEEPENNLHKSMQIELSQILFENTDDYPFLFVSTHSPYILYEMNDVTLIRIFAEKTVISKSAFYQVPSEYQQNKKMLNQLLSEAIFANRVLLVEGPSEKLLFDRILTYKMPYYETKGIYILVVNGISFRNYKPILDKLGIYCVIKTDNDIQNHKNGCYALGFSRINGIIGMEILPALLEWAKGKRPDKETFLQYSKSYRERMYVENQNLIHQIQTDYHVFVSKVDLENDLNDVISDRMREILNNENPVKYLQSAKNNHMVELVKELSDTDCDRIYNHPNFSCLKDI